MTWLIFFLLFFIIRNRSVTLVESIFVRTSMSAWRRLSWFSVGNTHTHTHTHTHIHTFSYIPTNCVQTFDLIIALPQYHYQNMNSLVEKRWSSYPGISIGCNHSPCLFDCHIFLQTFGYTIFLFLFFCVNFSPSHLID